MLWNIKAQKRLSSICGVILWIFAASLARANPYLAKPGEAPVTVYVATCAVSGGFIQLYTALDQNLFEKYGIAIKHVVIRGGTNINLAALGADEVQFLCLCQEACEPAPDRAAQRRRRSIEVAREAGAKVSKKVNEIVDNGFAKNLEKSGFMKELWGGKLPN